MLFKPSAAATLGMLTLVTLCGFLGSWQLQRAAAKDVRLAEYAQAVEMEELPAADDATEFTRISIQGNFDTSRHILADNKVCEGRAGVHVYTPFAVDGDETILVNRGWLPLADRRHLPAVETPPEHLTISGRIGPVPSPGRQLGETGGLSTSRWPQLVTYPEITGISDALGETLYPQVLFLDENVPGGFEGRNWKPVFMTPSRHRAYAFQWFALAATSLVGWLALSVLKGSRS
jgi:surfeit locus 1 family protein